MQFRKNWPALIGIAIATILLPISYLSREAAISARKAQASSAMLQLAETHLVTADKRIEEAIQTHFGSIVSLFNDARSNASEFAVSALGWSSKWRIVADAVPFTRGDRHEEFLKKQFESQVLSGSKLERAVEQSVVEFLAEIRSVESKMLVDLRADMESISKDYNIETWRAEEIQLHFDEALARASRIAGIDLQSNIHSQIVSIVVGEVLTQVAIRLGVSAGILGTGAASGWVTLGVGVVVGIIIDQIVMTIWNQWSDPKADLVNVLTKQLSMMQGFICYGDETTQGLLQHFEIIAKTRSQLRRAAVLEDRKSVV